MSSRTWRFKSSLGYEYSLSALLVGFFFLMHYSNIFKIQAMILRSNASRFKSSLGYLNSLTDIASVRLFF